MSSILRKKIESGSGVAPSILRFKSFWDQVRRVTADWALEGLGADSALTCDYRRVVTGAAALNLMEQRTGFIFPARLSPGLCALGLDRAGAIRAGAHRLQQAESNLETASDLFLKLLFEQPALSLWQHLSATLPQHSTETAEKDFCAPAAAAGAFDPSGRYLIAAYSSAPSGQILMIFHLDFVQHAAQSHERERERLAGERGGRAQVLRASVRDSVITLDAVPSRMTLSIGECSRLTPGQILPLTDYDAQKIALCAETLNGSLEIGWGEMGVWKTQRALKLTSPISEPVMRELSQLQP